MNKDQIFNQVFRLALKGEKNVSPNPMVGCVITKDNRVINTGYHHRFGGIHAEIDALQKAGHQAKGAEMFLNLEPCCHCGKTPPCTEAIIAAGIKKVSISILDPNPLVAGKGVQTLRQKGIKIEVGHFAEKAQKLNERFIHFVQAKTPFTALKMAVTLDGKITRCDRRQWITNSKARKYVHKLRQRYDAVLVGKNTVMQDNPNLTTYLLNNRNNPLRIVLDSKLELPISKKVFADSNFIIVTVSGHSQEKKKKYLQKGGQVLEVKNDYIDLNILLKQLGKMNISSLLVEGGSQIFTSFINQKCAQKIYLFQAPIFTGENGLNCLGAINEIVDLKNVSSKKIDDNFLMTASL